MKDNIVMMVLDRNYTVPSVLGHMITFKKGQPTPVPKIMMRTCAQAGAKCLAPDVDPFAENAETKKDFPVDPSQRLEDIGHAIDTLVVRNQRGDWSAGNKPKFQSVSEIVGYRVDQTEVARAWKLRQEAALEKAAQDDSENEAK